MSSLRRVWLICGVLSSVLYVAMNVFVGMQWEGYSYASRTISELSAIGAPTRPIWVLLGLVYTSLAIAFAWGVWGSARRNRPLRVVGGLMGANAALGLAWPFAPMHMREVLAAGGGTLADTAHIVLSSVTVLLMMLAIGFGAAALGKRFRLYSIATLVVLIAFGVPTFLDGARVPANLPTPWLGVWERIDVGVYMLWVAVLAAALLRAKSLALGSIAEVEYLKLGGLDQWVMIRGESLSNPPLILLHGGPGLTETSFFRYFNAELEKSFTVVYWDQRGTGKSFDRNIPRSSMTVEQFIADLDELVDAVCKRLGKNKVAIFGHSWGSALGVLYAARFPEKVAAYVGSGQVGDWAAAESSSYAFALAEAQRLGNDRALKKLRAIGPPPHDAKSLWAERMCVSRFEGRLGARAMWKMGRVILGAPGSSILDLPNAARGFGFSLDAMWSEVSRLNLMKLAPALQMPVFFFLGRKDHWVPPEISVAYFDALTAPSKKLVWFEESKHEPFIDEPAKFNAAMLELVRPLLTTDVPARAA